MQIKAQAVFKPGTTAQSIWDGAGFSSISVDRGSVLIVRAAPGNQNGDIYVGDSTVTAADVPLEPGKEVTFSGLLYRGNPISLKNWFVIADHADDEVFVYVLGQDN